MEQLTLDASFWQAFWPALASGAIYSLLVGVAVGLIVLYAQKRLESRIYLRRLDREFASALQQLRTGLERPGPMRFESPEDAAPVGTKPAVTVIRNIPLLLWIEELKGHSKVLASMSEFQTAYDEFARVAGDLASSLRISLGLYVKEEQISNFPRQHFIPYATGRIVGLDSDESAVFTGMEVSDEAILDKAYSEIQQDSTVSRAKVAYIHGRDALTEAKSQLKTAMIELFTMQHAQQRNR